LFANKNINEINVGGCFSGCRLK